MTNLLRFSILAILLLAFGLRTLQLDAQSLWSDEGISLLRSSEPLDQLLQNMPVEHMPGYFVLLHYWLPLVSDHDFGVRFLSLLPSVAAVALSYRLAIELANTGASVRSSHRPGAMPPLQLRAGEQPIGDHLGKKFVPGGLIGISTALLLSTSAFQVWYAQEARMYSWLLAAGVASHLFFWKLLSADATSALIDRSDHTSSEDKDQPAINSIVQLPVGIFVAYVSATALSVYLHYYGFLVPLSQVTYIVIWTPLTRHWLRTAWWIIAGGLIFLLFLPWLPRALAIFSFSGWRPAGDPWQIPWQYFAMFTSGSPATDVWYSQAIWIYWLAAATGAIFWIYKRLLAGLFLLICACLPIGIIIFLALRNPDFHERYAIAVSTPVLLLISGAIGSLSLASWSLDGKFRNNYGFVISSSPAVLLLFLFAGTNLFSLQNQMTDTSLHKPDFRGAAWRIQMNEQPGDVILVDGPDPQKVFLHYYRGNMPVHDLRFLADAEWEKIDQYLTDATEGKKRLWELLYFHGPGPIQVWTATNAWATAPTNHNGIRVTLYGLSTENDSKSILHHEMNVQFGPGLVLQRVDINGEQFAAGDLVRVSTTWQVLQQLPDYKFSLRLTTDDNAIYLGRDYIPQNWISPTTMWIVGSHATDQHGLLLPTDMPAGQYAVTLRLYDPASGSPVETDAGQDVLLQKILVTE